MNKFQQFFANLVQKFNSFYQGFKTNTDLMNDEEKKLHNVEKFGLIGAGIAALICVMYWVAVPASPQVVVLASESSHESLTVVQTSSTVSASTGDGIGGAGGEGGQFNGQGGVDEGGAGPAGVAEYEDEDLCLDEEAGICSLDLTCDSEI